MSNSAPLSISPALMPGHGYDALASFDHLAYIGAVPTAFVIHPSVPVATLAELTAWIKAQDQPVQFGSGGLASVGQIVGELYARATGACCNIPYKGSGAMRNDLLGGQIRSPWTRCRRTCPICAPASCGCWPSPQSGACRRRRTFPPWAN